MPRACGTSTGPRVRKPRAAWKGFCSVYGLAIEGAHSEGAGLVQRVLHQGAGVAAAQMIRVRRDVADMTDARFGTAHGIRCCPAAAGHERPAVEAEVTGPRGEQFEPRARGGAGPSPGATAANRPPEGAGRIRPAKR